MASPLEGLLVRLRKPLLAYLGKIGPAQEAEDRFGEVVLRVLRNPPGPEIRDLEAWLFGVARRVAATPQRGASQWATSQWTTAALAEVADAGDPFATIERTDLTQAIAEALRRVDPEMRRALFLHHAESVPLGDLAPDLGIEVPILAARMSRARRRIAEGLSASERATFAAFGFVAPDGRSTEIWCPRCGDAKLRAEIAGASDRVTLACPRCESTPLFVAEGKAVRLVEGTPGVSLKRFLRISRSMSARWRGVAVPCPGCGARGTLHARSEREGLAGGCSSCKLESLHHPWEVALASPSGWSFWQTHRRIEQRRDEDGWLMASRTSGDRLRLPIDAYGCPTPEFQAL